MGATWTKYINRTVNPAPLAGFRLSFGLVMLVNLILFWQKGYIESFYIFPKFHFPIFGFDWMLLPGHYVYVVFTICVLAAIGVMVGYKYRWSITLFFLSFTYISVLDMSVYLNQCYLISLISFLMIFLPANTAFSIDSLWSRRSYKTIPKWCVDSLKLLIALVFIYKGLGTLNSDWLIHGEPFKTWLFRDGRFGFLDQDIVFRDWIPLILSWCLTLFCLALPFVLLNRKLRFIAFLVLLIWSWCFSKLVSENIFPFILVISTLIFFSSAWHLAVIRIVRQLLSPIQYGLKLPTALKMTKDYTFQLEIPKVILGIFFIIQLLLPLRFLSYPGHLFWTEQGLRWSWRSLLMDKTGEATFKIIDQTTGDIFIIDNSHFLSERQEKHMSTNPNLILNYAHKLGDYYIRQGHKNIQVFVASEVTLNGHSKQKFINPEVDLYQEIVSIRHKNWILPFLDTIEGL